MVKYIKEYTNDLVLCNSLGLQCNLWTTHAYGIMIEIHLFI